MCERSKRPDAMSETELIVAAQAGDDEATTYLLTEYGPLCGVIRKLSREVDPNGTAPDDLRQTGQLEALRALGRFDPAAGVRFTTFIYKRIRGAMLEAIHGKQARSAKPTSAGSDIPQFTLVFAGSEGEDQTPWQEDLANADPQWGRDPGYEDVERKDQARHLRLVISGIPTEQREVVESVFWRGETHDQTAVRRGVSRPAVTQMLGRATARLGRELEKVRDDLVA